METQSIYLSIKFFVVIGHICGLYGRKPYMKKVDIIKEMRECAHTIDVWSSMRSKYFLSYRDTSVGVFAEAAWYKLHTVSSYILTVKY